MPGLVDELNSEYWDYIAEKKMKSYVNNPFFEHKQDEINKLIKKWAGEKTNGVVLKTDLFEEGVRPGSILKKEWYGIDISGKVVVKARRKGFRKLVVGDVRKTPFKNNVFDLIISTSTIDHFPEISEALNELYRIMRKGGIMILTLENKHNFLLNFFCNVKKISKRINMETVYYDKCYSISEAEKLVKSAGFRMVEASCIINTPFSFSRIMNFLYKYNSPGIIKDVFEKFMKFFDKNMKKNKFLSFNTGLFIALKCEKV